jgi:hypothetical protein
MTSVSTALGAAALVAVAICEGSVVLAAGGPLPFGNGTVHCAELATPREPVHHLPTELR